LYIHAQVRCIHTYMHYCISAEATRDSTHTRSAWSKRTTLMIACMIIYICYCIPICLCNTHIYINSWEATSQNNLLLDKHQIGLRDRSQLMNTYIYVYIRMQVYIYIYTQDTAQVVFFSIDCWNVISAKATHDSINTRSAWVGNDGWMNRYRTYIY